MSNNKEFKKQIKKLPQFAQLVNVLHCLGYKVRFVESIPNARPAVKGRVQHSPDKIVWVKILDKEGNLRSISQICRTFAHEYRHCWQQELGMFKSVTEHNATGITRVACERDAIDWAEKYILNFYTPQQVGWSNYNFKNCFLRRS